MGRFFCGGLCRHLLFAASCVVGIVFAAPASARTWLAPIETAGESRGPEHALGVVVWSHGRSIHSEDSEAPSPPYLHIMAEAGFDVLRFNRLRMSDTLDGTAAVLADHAATLKQQGYRQVVLAGQSFGAFLSLIAAGRSDAVDAVIATAPAAYGNFSESPESWRRNATVLEAMLSRVRSARVFLGFFHGDGFDPGGRAASSEAILSTRGLAHMIIDQPRELPGHGAAGTGLFARRFGDCLVRFATRAPLPADPTCEGTWGRAQRIASGHGGAAAGRIDPSGEGSPFRGRWSGIYINGRTVEVSFRDEPQTGTDGVLMLEYRLGDGILPGEIEETTQRVGRIVRGSALFDEPGRNRLRFTPRPDGRLRLVWVASDGEGTLESVLHAVPGES